MTHTEYEWILLEKKVFAQSWLPDQEAKAIICLVHGYGEHSGRYGHWGKLFTDAGYALLSMDLFGHGQTEGSMGRVESFQALLDQVDGMLQKSEELFPAVPRVLYGHSMGGNVVINYTISREAPISALIATSPWLRLVTPVSALEKVFSKLFNSLAPGLRIKTKGLGAEKLSNDPEHWESVRSDSLCFRKISVRYAYEIIKHGEYAISHVSKIKNPFLLMHGSGDEITSHKASQELADNSPEGIQFKIWDGFRHEMHNSLEKKDVFDHIINWLKENGL